MHEQIRESFYIPRPSTIIVDAVCVERQGRESKKLARVECKFVDPLCRSHDIRRYPRWNHRRIRIGLVQEHIMPSALDRNLSVYNQLPLDVDEHKSSTRPGLLNYTAKPRALCSSIANTDGSCEICGFSSVHATRQPNLRNHAVSRRCSVWTQVRKRSSKRKINPLPGWRQLRPDVTPDIGSGERATVRFGRLWCDEPRAYNAHGSTPLIRSSAMRAAS